MNAGRARRYLGILLAGSFVLNLVTGLAGVPAAWYRYTINGIPEVDYTSPAPRSFLDRNVEGNYYLELAEGLRRGHGYGGVGQAMPLYPLILAGVLGVFGRASWPLLLLQALCGTAIVLFTYLTARILFSLRVALVAGLLIMVHPYLVKLTMQIIDTGPSVALTAAGMWAFVASWVRPTPSPGRYGLAGAVMALATLSRPVGAIHTVALALAMLVRSVYGRRRLAGAAAIFVLAWAVVMSPWWVNNYIRYRSFIVLTTHGGLAMLTGHSPDYTRVHPTYDVDWFPYVDWPVKPAHDPSGALYNALCMRTVVAYVGNHPWTAIATDLRKIVWLYTWHKVPRSLVDSHPRWDPRTRTVIQEGRPRAAPQDLLYSAYWVPTFALALFGLWRSRHDWPRFLPIYALILANALTAALTFPDTRYRLEVDPYIVMWAAYAVTCLVMDASERRRGRFPMRTSTE